MRSTRSAVPILAVLLALGIASVASAQEAPAKVKLLPLRVSGAKVTPEQSAKLTDALVVKLKKYSGFEVLPVPAADPVDMMVDAGCTDLDSQCLAGIGAEVAADRVLYTEVGEKDGTTLLQMRFVDVKTKKLTAPEPMTVAADKLPPALASSVEKILGPEPKVEPQLVRVDLATNPTGAEMYVDKDFVGVSPVTVRLKPGTYTVRATRVGYQDQSAPLVVEEGKAAVSRSLTLPQAVVAIPVAPPPAEPRKEKPAEATPFYKTWWFWTVVGAVVVGTGTAVYFGTRSSGSTGSAGFTPDPYYAPNDVLVIRSK